MAFQIGSFFARLGIDTSEYSGGLLSAQAANAAFGQTFTNFVANPVAGAIGILKQTGSLFVDLAKSTADYAEQMSFAASNANLSVTTYQALREELVRSGQNADALSDQFRAFGNVLDAAKNQGGAAAAAFNRIGIDPATVQQNEAGIRRVLEAVAGLTVEQGRSAIAQDLFGRSGAALANAIAQSGGAVQSLIDKYRNFGLVLDEQAIAKGKRLDDTIDSLEQSFDGLKRTLSNEFFGSFAEALGAIDDKGENTKKFLDDSKESVRELGTALGELARTLKEIEETTKLLKQFLDYLNNAASVISLFIGSAAEGGGNWTDFKAAWGKRLGALIGGRVARAADDAVRKKVGDSR